MTTIHCNSHYKKSVIWLHTEIRENHSNECEKKHGIRTIHCNSHYKKSVIRLGSDIRENHCNECEEKRFDQLSVYHI